MAVEAESVAECAYCKAECNSECSACGTPYCSAECIGADCDCHNAVCGMIHEEEYVGVSISKSTMKKLADDPATVDAIKIEADSFYGDGRRQIETYARPGSGVQVYGLPKFRLGVFTRKFGGMMAPVAVEVVDGDIYLILISDRGKRARRPESEELTAYRKMMEDTDSDKKKEKMTDFFKSAIEYMKKNPHNMEKWLAAARKKAASPKKGGWSLRSPFSRK